MLIVVSVNNKILLPLDLQCLLKPYNDYDIWYNPEEIEQWNFYIGQQYWDQLLKFL